MWLILTYPSDDEQCNPTLTFGRQFMKIESLLIFSVIHMFRYTSSDPAHLNYSYNLGPQCEISFCNIAPAVLDGICCKEFRLRIQCYICDVDVLVPVSCKFYYKYSYDSKLLCRINDRIALSHNHNNILDKLVRVKCDVAGKDFYINGKNIASIEDRTCVGLNLSNDVMCGLCNTPGISALNEVHPPNDVNVMRLSNLMGHYRKHQSELRETESVDIALAAEQIYNSVLEITKELDRPDILEGTLYQSTINVNVSKIIEIVRDCDCGYKKIVRCKLCDREFKAEYSDMDKIYKKCLKYHFNKRMVTQTYKDFIYIGPAKRELIGAHPLMSAPRHNKICYCELCGQEYGSLNPNKDIVINHFDACLAKHKGMAKSLGLQCSKK